MGSYADVLLWTGLLGLFAALPLTVSAGWLWLRLSAVPALLGGLWFFYALAAGEVPGALYLTIALTSLLALGYLGGLVWRGLGKQGFAWRSSN